MTLDREDNMDKGLLHGIISAGFLRSHCNRAVMYFKSRNLHCDFISDDMEVKCTVMSEKFNDGNDFIGSERIGLPNIESFLKMLKTLGKDIDASITKEGRDEKYLVLDDDNMQMKYGLINKSQMPYFPPDSTFVILPNPCEIHVDSGFMKRFYDLAGAIKDCKYLFVHAEDRVLYLTLSQSDNYTAGAVMKFDIEEEYTPFEQMKFDIKKYKMILYNNRKMNQGRIQFHGKFCKIDFVSTKIKLQASYYIISK